MSLADAFVGFVKAVATHGRMEGLLRELRWSIDARKGDMLVLNFRCPVIGTRQVFINGGDEPVVLFTVYSKAEFDSRSVPDTAMALALYQNEKISWGKWEISMGNDNILMFRMTYTALGAGLNAVAVKHICESMAKGASQFDERLRQEGHL